MPITVYNTVALEAVIRLIAKQAGIATFAVTTRHLHEVKFDIVLIPRRTMKDNICLYHFQISVD